jgi:peroxiredoxin Q/BCP
MMFAWLFSDPLPVGTPAPDFSLPDDSGGVVRLSAWRGVEVFGVNPQSARSHVKFRGKFHFPFPLLVDQGQKVAALYHANGPIVKRTVYRIGPDGVIRFARRGMPSPEEVLG